jgi:hypothetical protein
MSRRQLSESDALTDRAAPHGNIQCQTMAVVGAGKAAFHGPLATGHRNIWIAASLAPVDFPAGPTLSAPRPDESLCWHTRRARHGFTDLFRQPECHCPFSPLTYISDKRAQELQCEEEKLRLQIAIVSGIVSADSPSPAGLKRFCVSSLPT